MQYYYIIASQAEDNMSLETRVGRFLFDLRDVASSNVSNALTVELKNAGIDPVKISKCLQIVNAEHVKVFSNAIDRIDSVLKE